jgi:hypothetical protein
MSLVTLALLGRTTMPSRSVNPKGAHATKPPLSFLTPTLDAVVGQVAMASSVEVNGST